MPREFEFVVVDVETTGLFPKGHDRVIELAAFRVDPRGKVLDRYATLLNPQRDVGATHVHGICAADARNAPTFDVVAGDILSLLAGAVFVAHNAQFDRRFILAEFDRLGCVLPDFPCLCTMQLALRADSALPSRKLAAVCKHFGIPLKRAHSAESDARATASLLACCIERLGGPEDAGLLSRLGAEGSSVARSAWPTRAKSNRSHGRTDAEALRASERSYINRLVERLPSNSDCSEGMIEYLMLLDRVLEDRRITQSEFEDLVAQTTSMGMSKEAAREVHIRYMRDLIGIALEDEVITAAEEKDLQEVRSILDIAESDYKAILAEIETDPDAEKPMARSRVDEYAGKSVCFTGTLTSRVNGETVSRAFAESAARSAGMVVVRSCTKKLDFLVAADPDSMSGKAGKARKYGVRILAEPVFWRIVGVEVE